MLVLQWPCLKSGKTVIEDRYFISKENRLGVVADGVTRTGYQGEYPDPSPAAEVAQVVVQAIGHTICTARSRNENLLRTAFIAANRAAREKNQELGLWEDHNWWDRDLGGAVCAAVMLADTEYTCGHIGDCGVAHFARDVRDVWHTVDDIARIRRYLPGGSNVRERMIKVRRDHRNKPFDSTRRTFGVLTGEDDAIAYVKTQTRHYRPGDMLVVYTDGIAPLVLHDHTFQGLLMERDEKQIQEYAAARSSVTHYADEKTLIIIEM